MASVGVWSPFPPQRSGIADYSFSLLGELAKRLDVTAVLDDRFNSVVPGRVRTRLRVPDGVEAINASELGRRSFDCNVYQMGNNAEFHTYMHSRILDEPGLLVLHDPSLFDFYVSLCGGASTSSFRDEVQSDLRTSTPTVPMMTVDGERRVDRLAIPMSRRLVEASAATVVHSAWAAELIAKRSPGAAVTRIYLPAKVLERRRAERRSLTFGILGGVNHHKRVVVALDAFARVHREFPDARLIIAGRIDASELVESIEAAIHRSNLSSVVSIRYDVAAGEFDKTLIECDVLIALRWPTAGETSGLVMRAFGAAMPVIATDVPQFREFDERFCWRVPVGAPEEREVLVDFMRRALENPHGVVDAATAAQLFVQGNATFEIAAAQYQDAIDSCIESRPSVALSRSRLIAPAVNAIGCWSAATGVGEAARRAVLALSNAGVAVALSEYEIDVPKDPRRIPPGIAALPKGRPAEIEISFLNINELHGVRDEFLRPEPGRYLMTYWYWELPDLPEQLVPEVRRFDEIWVASRFVKGNLARYTKSPIVVMPSVVAPEPDSSISRRDFGLPEKSCLFLLNFDVGSGVARKNPFAAIDAFSKAFARREAGTSAHLVLKTSNLDRFEEAGFELWRRLDRVGGIVIDDQLTDREVATLTNCCDVYVSLHRAEGFGLGMAEAMYLGIPAIATRYSGSEDFLTTANSCGVGYRMERVKVGDLRYNAGAELLYRPGMQWASPDVDQAARWMRILFDNPSIRRQLGQEASATIRRLYSLDAAGRAMRSRLEQILFGERDDYAPSEGAA